MIQTMEVADEDKFDFDPLDDTKTWPEDIFPLQPVGRMVLNKNPDNFFNENEQVAYCPALIVPGGLCEAVVVLALCLLSCSQGMCLYPLYVVYWPNVIACLPNCFAQ